MVHGLFSDVWCNHYCNQKWCTSARATLLWNSALVFGAKGNLFSDTSEKFQRNSAQVSGAKGNLFQDIYELCNATMK